MRRHHQRDADGLAVSGFNRAGQIHIASQDGVGRVGEATMEEVSSTKPNFERLAPAQEMLVEKYKSLPFLAKIDRRGEPFA
jgi:hypothetical protein